MARQTNAIALELSTPYSTEASTTVKAEALQADLWVDRGVGGGALPRAPVSDGPAEGVGVGVSRMKKHRWFFG